MSESVSSSNRKRGGSERSHSISRKPRWDQLPSPEGKRMKGDYPSDRPHEYKDLADRPSPRYKKPSYDRHYSSGRDSRREHSDKDSRKDHPDRDYESCRRSSRPQSLHPNVLRDQVPRDQQLIIEKLPSTIRHYELLPFLKCTLNEPRWRYKFDGNPIVGCKTYSCAAILYVRSKEEAHLLLGLGGMVYMGEKITVRHPGSYPTLRPQNDEKAKSSTTDQKDISKKENTSKKKAPSEANYYGPGGQVDKPQAHSTSLVPVSASARTNGSKNKKSSSIKTEENMSNFQVQGNLVQKSTAAPADNDVIDLSLDDENSDSASMNPKMSNAAAATAAADLPPPPTPEEAPPVNQDKGSTDQDELAATKDELAQLREEINNLLRNRSAEESLAKEKQKSQEVQKKYETLMQEYTELGKDYRRVSKSLVTATEQQMELQRLLKTEQEKRHEADTHCKAEQEARIKLQKELEKIQVKWIRDVRELKTKLVKSEIKSDPESDVTATAQAAPAAAASVQAESSVRHVAPVKREPAQVKYEEEVWDL